MSTHTFAKMYNGSGDALQHQVTFSDMLRLMKTEGL